MEKKSFCVRKVWAMISDFGKEKKGGGLWVEGVLTLRQWLRVGLSSLIERRYRRLVGGKGSFEPNNGGPSIYQ